MLLAELVNKLDNKARNIHTYAHLKISLSINKVLNSSEELMHTLSRAEVNWSHELINTANDWPHLIKDSFTVSMI